MSSISSSAVDGLVSGLNTSGIITSLIAADAAPQTRMKSSVSAAQLKVTAFQSINTKILAMQDAAAKLQDATSWNPTKATSSHASVAVSAGSGAAVGSVNVTVTGIAKGKTTTSGVHEPGVTSLSTVLGGSPLDVMRSDGKFVTITPSSGTLTDVADAINRAEDLGIKAVAIRVGENKYRLQITSTRTGTDVGEFKIAAHGGVVSNGRDGLTRSDYASVTDVSAGNGYTSTAATNASINTGTGDPDFTSKTNTFANIMTGLSLTVSEVTASPVKISVTQDSAAVASAMEGLVTAANAVLSDIALQTRAGTPNANGSFTGGGSLRGDSGLRSLQGQIINAVTSAITATGTATSAVTIGVQSTRDGKITFDKAKFLSAYEANPTGVKNLVATKSVAVPADGKDGLATRLQMLGEVSTGKNSTTGVQDPTRGTLTAAISGQNNSISDLTKRIADWDVRLEQKKAQYQKYYGAMEVSLGKLKSQSSWLAGQLASLQA
ncbi:flagellar hook-associated protein 2 [Kineococcus xinjiangensis]|uniref:Flagellar hook-associated protein 2 n=1 Tax=Kineococcus xinjiangensis TaxID=512762 RepID=A0A2S6IK12_9ACTN|nr:flagellar filament capping protein FliD [Kineococcus xinjiangensis]PPK94500.1 flagellar hook-associated protein 2 [Kineococcus xinjiangensis]